MKLNQIISTRAELVDSALIAIGFALFAGSKRGIEYLPNTSPTGLFLSAVVGRGCAFVSGKCASTNESKVLRSIRVGGVFTLSSALITPLLAKILKKESLQIHWKGALRFGVLASSARVGVAFLDTQPSPNSGIVNLEELGRRIQRGGAVTAPRVDHHELQWLYAQYPASSNLLSKDHHIAKNLINKALQYGLPILGNARAQNQEFKDSLCIALDGIIRDKNPSHQKQQFGRLCAAFQGCQPEQQRVVASIAGSYQAFGGNIENFLFEELQEYLDFILEQTIRELHGRKISENFNSPHLQMPHIKSQYLKHFAEAGICLPNYRIASFDHILRGAYGGTPPYSGQGIATFNRLLDEGFSDFANQTALQLSEENGATTKWLNDLCKENGTFIGFGFYSDTKTSDGDYEGQKPSTENQMDLRQPYVSRKEMLALFKHYNFTL